MIHVIRHSVCVCVTVCVSLCVYVCAAAGGICPHKASGEVS